MKRRNPTLLQVIVHIGGWVPLVILVFDFFTNNLTFNPIQAIEQRTGLYGLTFLVLSLACTPAASLLGIKELLRRRKTLPFNGYADEVAALYAGMDLRANY
jgi:DMSO/TMAO reductase YedYZ heme-binding membrane subunit